jgi:hypothetical protein
VINIYFNVATAGKSKIPTDLMLRFGMLVREARGFLEARKYIKYYYGSIVVNPINIVFSWRHPRLVSL